MKQQNIRPGMVLRLKKDRAEAYGATAETVKVAELRAHSGYKTKWVVAEEPWQDIQGVTHPRAFYHPSDFAEEVRRG